MPGVAGRRLFRGRARVLSGPGPATFSVPVAQVWSEPGSAGPASMVTEGLLGEPAEVHSLHDGWAEVTLPWQPSSLDDRGYPGYVRQAALTWSGSAPGVQAAVVVVQLAAVARRLGAGRPGGGEETLSFGTLLSPAGGEVLGEGVGVGEPGGDHGGPEAGQLECEAGGDLWRVGAPALRRLVAAGAPGLIEAASVFLGVGYVWGGTSGRGIDCSGLVHLAYRSLGRMVPRDAHDQREWSVKLGEGEEMPGDLVFFSRPGKPPHHVGILARPRRGDGEMLHAPRSGLEVQWAEVPSKDTGTVIEICRMSPKPLAVDGAVGVAGRGAE
ncbi:MAG: C40 family peptidase [Acidimicrobiales bacterium]